MSSYRNKISDSDSKNKRQPNQDVSKTHSELSNHQIYTEILPDTPVSFLSHGFEYGKVDSDHPQEVTTTRLISKP
ncbi:hypothetical protein NC653_030106 [Populus alba x Populus x berolinensis]|uniref:Uncharacterized protein n=1 Tax=Populus alba x Populus x berolinensis TaxID=444605 RepID=A0AAD6PZV2_9ROSI|nr:hypothetical protein NC653_030106 [Populus alba x Populus x berolinensis]